MANFFNPLTLYNYTSPDSNSLLFNPSLRTSINLTVPEPQLIVPSFLSPRLMNEPSLVSPNSPTAVNKLIKYQDMLYPYGVRSSILMTKPEIDMDLVDDVEYQKKMVKYLFYRVLDHWLAKGKYCYILNYLNITESNVSHVSGIEEAKKNVNCSKSRALIEKGVDFIENNVFNIDDMRKLCYKVIKTLGFKWYNLGNSKEEEIVAEVAITYIKRKLKKMAGIKKSKK